MPADGQLVGATLGEVARLGWTGMEAASYAEVPTLERVGESTGAEATL
jgi:hypothetical protein